MQRGPSQEVRLLMQHDPHGVDLLVTECNLIQYHLDILSSAQMVNYSIPRLVNAGYPLSGKVKAILEALLREELDLLTTATTLDDTLYLTIAMVVANGAKLSMYAQTILEEPELLLSGNAFFLKNIWVALHNTWYFYTNNGASRRAVEFRPLSLAVKGMWEELTGAMTIEPGDTVPAQPVAATN